MVEGHFARSTGSERTPPGRDPRDGSDDTV